MEWLPRNPGTLLTVIPAHDNQLLAIVGYLLPPKPQLPQPSQQPQSPLRLPGTSQADGELVVDRDHHRVLLAGREIELVFQEFELLDFLTARPRLTFTREQILAGAWGNRQQATKRTVDVHIHRLRRKLGPEYAESLVTVRRVGYMFRPPTTP
jgi:DNA-binding response OmpR family regulator